MLFTKLAVLAFAALVAAEPAETEHQNVNEARAPFLGVVYSESNFRGSSQTIIDRHRGQCINLRRPVRESVRSIRIDRSQREECTLWDRENCRGTSRTFRTNDNMVRPGRYSSVLCRRRR